MISSQPALFSVLDLILDTAFFGQYHSAKFISAPIFVLAIYAVWTKKTKAENTLMILILIISGIACFNGLYEYIAYWFGDNISMLTSFNFDRFTFIIPFCFFLILLILNRDWKLKNAILYLGITAQLLLILYSNSEFRNNITNLSPWKNENLITFRSFYSEKLFDGIENYIGYPKKDFRVVSIGMHPSIAQYNGFYTLDSYQNNYPLSYKTEFRKIIKEELDKSKRLKDYFDNWGSRSYIFSAELRESCYLVCKKDSNVAITNISLNTDKLREMGARYIFSAVPILNAAQLNLKREKVFENSTSSWQIYLYKIL
jgi:hypothetical protein